jgi:hypothetical protein
VVKRYRIFEDIDAPTGSYVVTGVLTVIFHFEDDQAVVGSNRADTW